MRRVKEAEGYLPRVKRWSDSGTSVHHDRAQPGVIVVEPIEDAEPLNAITDLEALEEPSQSLELGELGGNAGARRAAVDPARLHPVARVEWAKR